MTAQGIRALRLERAERCEAARATEYKTGMVPISAGYSLGNGKLYVLTDDGSLLIFGERKNGDQIPLSAFRWKKA